MHALRSQLDDVEREVKQHSTILNQILKTLKSLENRIHTEKSHTPASRHTTTSALTPSSDLTSAFSASFMETPQTDGSIPSCGTNSSMETATPFAFLSSDMVFGAVGLKKKEIESERDVLQKPGGVHFVEPIALPLNDVLAEESESDGPFENKDVNPYKHVDTPVPTLSQRQKVATASSGMFSKIVSPTDSFNKAVAKKQFPTALFKPPNMKMSKQDRVALPPKRTVFPVPQSKGPAPAKSPPTVTTDVLLHLPTQPAHLPRRAAGGNILDSHEVFRRKMTRKLQTESAEQLRKQFSSTRLHTLTPPDARTLHAVPFNASTNPKSTSSPTKPSSPRTRTGSTASVGSIALKGVTVTDATVEGADTGMTFSYHDFSTPPMVTARSDPTITTPATVPGATVPTRLPKRTSPEKSTAVKGPDRATTFHTPKVLRSRREAPVSKSALLMPSLAGANSGSSHSSPRNSVSARLEAAHRRKTTAAATAAIASTTTATNKIIAQLQAKNHGKVLRGGNKGDGSSDSPGKAASVSGVELSPIAEDTDPSSQGNAAVPPSTRVTPPKSPRRSPKNIQHSPVYTRHPDQWSTTRPLSAAKQALMSMQSPTAGATRRRSISGASNRSSISASGSAKNSPYNVSGEKSGGVVGSVTSPLPTPDYPPPAPPTTPTSAQHSSAYTNPATILTPIVANSPYINYHLDSYSKYAHIMATPATPAPQSDTASATEDFLLNHPPPSTPDRENWTNAGVPYATAPSPRAHPMPFPTSPSSRRSNIYTALHATPGAVEVEQSDSECNKGSSTNSVDSIDGSPAARPAEPTSTALVEECYSPYSPSAIGASTRYRFSSPTSAEDLNDTTIVQPSSTPMSATNTNTIDDSYTYATPSTTIMNSICLDFSTPADFYTLDTANSTDHTNFSTPMSGASDSSNSSGTPTINPTTTNNDLFSSSITRTNTIPNYRYGSLHSTSRVTFAPEATELSCRTSSTTMQANPIGSRMPNAGLHRSMTIRTQINTIGADDDRAGMAMMEPDTPLPAPSPFAAAVRVDTSTSIDAFPFSSAPATTATTAPTILRQCSTYKGTPRPRSRSRSSASATSETLEEDAEDAWMDSHDGDGGGRGGDSGGVGLTIAVTESNSSGNCEDNDEDLAAVAKDDCTHKQPASFNEQLSEQEQEHREAEDYTSLVDSLILDYFSQDHPRSRDSVDDGDDNSDGDPAGDDEQEGGRTRNWSTAPSIGDITDLFDTFDGFSDSAYHAFIGMEDEVNAETEEEEVEDEEKRYMAKQPTLVEDIAAIVRGCEDRDSATISSDKEREVNYGGGVAAMEGPSDSPGYGTMYAQLYTNDNDGNTARAADDRIDLLQRDNTDDVATRGFYATAVAPSEMSRHQAADEDLYIQYSPERPDAGRGRARSHARHSSGSFDGIVGIIRHKDAATEKEDTTPAESAPEEDAASRNTTDMHITNTNTILDTENTTITPATSITTSDTNYSDDRDVDTGEKFGEGEGEGGEGWQGVVGRHSARKKKAHHKVLQQEKQKEKQA